VGVDGAVLSDSEDPVEDCVEELVSDPDVGGDPVAVPEEEEDADEDEEVVPVEVELVDEEPGGGGLMPMPLIVNFPDAFPLSPKSTRM
jgi:hypothetical protein